MSGIQGYEKLIRESRAPPQKTVGLETDRNHIWKVKYYNKNFILLLNLIMKMKI